MSFGFGEMYRDLIIPPATNSSIWSPPGSNIEPVAVDPLTGEPLTPFLPTQSEQPQPAPPRIQRLTAEVREGVRVSGGDDKVFSTGPLSPGEVSGAWVNPQAARGADGVAATCIVGAGYTPALRASKFPLALPAGAQIIGIRVTVRRSKV